MARKIMAEIPDAVLKEDLERFRQRAIELGATDARIIPADTILIDERVRAKCIYPKCSSYGTNANCPPYAMDLDMTRKVVSRYKYAIFLMLKVPAAEVAGSDAREKWLSRPSQIKNQEIVSKLEAEAFHNGYHLALGFSVGSCKTAFCPEQECSALKGERCRNALRARSAMEAVGMDAYVMAANVGWDIYPIGRSTPAVDVPHGLRLGLVLIY